MDKPTNAILDAMFPKFCFGCRREGSYLCADCLGLVDVMEYSYCLCQKPSRLPPGSSGKCNLCRDKKLSGLLFAVSYAESPAVKKLIHQFKYQPYLKDAKTVLASLIIEHLVKSGNNTLTVWDNAILIPVPLDSKKLKLRGYNQSEELAKEISRIIDVPVLSDVLIKTKATEPQMELSKEEREKNLAGAFAIKNAAPVSGKKVFLVDDVYTTGSTLNECALVLRNEGAKSIVGLTLARES